MPVARAWCRALRWRRAGRGIGYSVQAGNQVVSAKTTRLATILTVAVFAALLAGPPVAYSGQYRVPPTNPFFGEAGARQEIYSYGLRNPFRFSFDRLTGDLAIGDPGNTGSDEIDFVARGKAAGANFGWNCWEGTRPGPGDCRPRGTVFPAYEYEHPSPRAVIGGYVVRDVTLPTLFGRYLFADFYVGDVMSTTLSASGASPPRSTGLHVDQLVSFGEDALGGLYAVSLAGPVIRLTAGTGFGTLRGSIIGTFDAPMYVTSPRGDPLRLFVAERGGRVKVRVGGSVKTFLDISTQVSTAGDGGLQSIAFAPDYAVSGAFYVFYSDLQGNIRVDEFRHSRENPDSANLTSQRKVLQIPHPTSQEHYGGQLQFGRDGLLYISTGDGGGRTHPNGNAQDLNSLLGKLLRIDPRLGQTATEGLISAILDVVPAPGASTAPRR